MQVTINEVRYAVHAALDAAFPDIPIAGEEIKQNLNPPCFFVKLLEPAHTQELGRRFYRAHPFDVHYFSPDRENADMYGLADRLTAVLQWIEVGGRKVRGTGMRYQIIEEVLHFFVDYNLHVWALTPEETAMQRLELEGGVK